MEEAFCNTKRLAFSKLSSIGDDKFSFFDHRPYRDFYSVSMGRVARATDLSSEMTLAGSPTKHLG